MSNDKDKASEQDKKISVTPVELIILIVIIAIVAAIAIPSLVRYNGQSDKRVDMATAHNIQIVLQAELTDLSNGGLSFVPGTDYNDTYIVASGTEAGTTNSVRAILEANGVKLPSGATLIDISVDESGGKLNHFVYQSKKSKIIYNGATLEQI